MTDAPFTEQILNLFRGRMDVFVRDHGRPILPETVASKSTHDWVYLPVPDCHGGTIADWKIGAPDIVKYRDELEREFREHSAEEFAAAANRSWDEIVAAQAAQEAANRAWVRNWLDIWRSQNPHYMSSKNQQMRWRRRRAQREV